MPSRERKWGFDLANRVSRGRKKRKKQIEIAFPFEILSHQRRNSMVDMCKPRFAPRWISYLYLSVSFGEVFFLFGHRSTSFASFLNWTFHVPNQRSALKNPIYRKWNNETLTFHWFGVIRRAISLVDMSSFESFGQCGQSDPLGLFANLSMTALHQFGFREKAANRKYRPESASISQS